MLKLLKKSQDFSHPPIKVNFSPSDNPEVEVDSRLQGIDTTNLNEIEQAFLQDKLDDLPEIITIADEDETLDLHTSKNEFEDESIMLEKFICQDLQEFMGEDEATLNLINMIQFHDRVQAGEDEATINLVTKLNTNAKAGEKHHEQERYKNS